MLAVHPTLHQGRVGSVGVTGDDDTLLRLRDTEVGSSSLPHPTNEAAGQTPAAIPVSEASRPRGLGQTLPRTSYPCVTLTSSRPCSPRRFIRKHVGDA